MKKILFFIHDMMYGGAEKVLVNLVNNMDSNKYDITVMTLFDVGVNKEFLLPKIKYKSVFKRLFKGNTTLLKFFPPQFLYKYLIQDEYDVVVSYLEGSCTRIVGGAPKDIKKIAWVHISQDEKEFRKPYLSKKEAIRIYNNFNKIACVSKNVKENFEKLSGIKGIAEVVYNTNETDKILSLSKENVENCYLKNKEIKIVDTTLRDGEQTAGVAFANHEKIAIAQALSDIGIDQLEVGIPTMGGDEKATIKAICKRNLKASIMAWNRAVVSDIEQSIDCGVDAVAISLSVSDIHIQHKLKKSREWVLENMFNAVSFAHKNGLYISVNGEDASRADTDFLIEFINVAKQAGANRFRFCDTVGVMEPFATREKIEKIHKATNFDIEMHTHNDFGMATANAIAGVIGGANYIGCTVNGLGERAGNAALEEVLMALKFVYGYDTDVDTTKFVEICKYVSQASGRRLPPWKAIVGTNMFRHESGIHADGALKDPKNYEAFDPAEVGLQRQIVIGKHSGKAAIVNKFKEYSIELTNEEANQILEEVRKVSVGLKRELFDKELVQIYHDIKNDYKIF